MGLAQTLPTLCRIGVTVCLLLVSHFYKARGDVVGYNADNTTVRFNSMPSNFGSKIPKDGVVGYLVSAVPFDGCTAIAPPPETNNTIGLFIALIRRNDCEFDLKVLNAQRAGYGGAIVRNVGSNSILPMSGSDDAGQVFIPSVFVGQNDGIELSEVYNYTTGKMVKITPGFVFPYHIYLIPFASIVGICFILMVGFMESVIVEMVPWATKSPKEPSQESLITDLEVAKYVRDRRRLRRARLSRDNLKKLPIKKFKKGDDYDICAICLDEYESGDKLRILPCNHAFHSKCVDPWLTNNRRTCPVCKRKVIPSGEQDSSDDSSEEDDGPNESTPLLIGSGNSSASTDLEETYGSPPIPPLHVDASTAMTPAEMSDEESTVLSSDTYEMADSHQVGPAGSTQPLKPMTEIIIEHEVLVERPDESDDSDDEFNDDDHARLQKV